MYLLFLSTSEPTPPIRVDRFLPQGTLAIVDNHAWLMEGTEDGITLAIKPNGITCTLSKFLPQYIAKNIAFFADGFLKRHNLGRDDGECFL